jgi:hypothetical protein
MRGIIVGWTDDDENEEPCTNNAVRRILLEASETFREPRIERFFPSTLDGRAPDDLSREAAAYAGAFPRDDNEVISVPARVIELMCLLDRVLFNVVKHGGRSHDPMVAKYLGGRVRRYWKLTLKLAVPSGVELWLPDRHSNEQQV